MLSAPAVFSQVTDILVEVVGTDPEKVTPQAHLSRDLAVDSLSRVEMAEELGRRFEVYIADQTVDEFITVEDVVNAVLVQASSPLPTSSSMSLNDSRRPALLSRLRSRSAKRLALWFIGVGAGLGLLFGLGGTALVSVLGIHDVDLPSLAEPTPTQTTATPTPTPTPRPSPSAKAEPVEEPSLNAEFDRVSPGQRFDLRGRMPGLREGVVLQVRVKDPGGAWDDFPVTTRVLRDGKFGTTIYTTRTGTREFRMRASSGELSPVVKVEIG